VGVVCDYADMLGGATATAAGAKRYHHNNFAGVFPLLQATNHFLARASTAVFSFLALLWRGITPLLRGVFGAWQPPGWLQTLGRLFNWGAGHVLARLGNLILVAALAFGGWVLWPQLQKWTQGITPERPATVQAAASPSDPARTEVENDKGPNPAVFSFTKPVAPIALVGKEAIDITLEPALPGRWSWASPTRLEFLPASDWPVGQKYSVKLGNKALAANVALESRNYSFTSPQFSARFDGAEFYQDPVQANLRRAVFAVRFSHPVSTAEFERRLSLNYDDACNKASGVAAALGLGAAVCASDKFNVSYDKYKVVATVQSEGLAIPEQTRAIALRIAAGATAQRGGPGTSSEVRRAVDVPGLFNAEIASVAANIVTNELGEPEHVLHVATSMPVHERELARVVQAWLLPVSKADTDADKAKTDEKFDWSAEPEAISDAVLKRAIRINLLAIAGEREVVDALSFRMPAAEGGRHLLVRVAKGMKTHGGYQLGNQRQDVLLLKTFAPELAIMSRGALLALSGEKKLPILVRDLPGVRVEIGRLLPQQLQHLVTQSQGEFAKPEFYNGITPDNLTERFEKTVTLSLRPGKAHYETVDFGAYLKADTNDRRGVFLLSVTGYDPKARGDSKEDPETAQQLAQNRNNEGEGNEGEVDPQERAEALRKTDKRLVLVTDLGIVAKKGLDGSRDVFVQSIASGQPVSGASVEVWGRNGSVLLSMATDATGRALLPNLSGYQRDKLPVVLVVRKAGDLSFLPFNKSDRSLDVSRFDVGGLRSAGVPNQMTAYVFSDRGIYRPGDSMNIAMVVKAGNWSNSLKDMPVDVEITDARGLSVRRDTLRLGPGGTAELQHTTQESAPTGNYAVNLYLPRSSTPGQPDVPPLLLGSTNVKVQEFMPDRTKVAARLSSETREGWVKPKDLKALVNVQNLFGTPAQNRRVDGVLTLAPAYPSFASYPDYSFYDPQRAKDKQTDELGSVQTNDKGDMEFDLRLQRFAAATYQAHVLVRAFEPEGGRSVSAEAQSLVSDLDYLVGVKVDGDASYISKGAVRNTSLIAIDANAKKTAVPKLTLQRVERKALSVLIKQNNGLYRYESRRKEVVLDEKPLAIAAGGTALALNTQTPGNFAYVVRNAEGLELNRLEYSVAGTANLARSMDRNAELQLTLNKKDYNPGEDIEVNIRAPYVGAGLITIERDKVYTHAWFKADTSASVQKITLPKDFEGSGYVSVHFIRDLVSDEIYTSPLSYGVVPFATSVARRSANITLTSSDLVKPGQVVKMKLTSDQPTRAVVFAVDEGILQVARYKTPDLLKHFFQKRALEVNTLQTLDMILPEFKKLMQGAAPGGDGEGESGKHLNPFKRKRDKPVVFWSGLVDVTGSKDFSYTVPESFNGSLRVMAVAVNDDTMAARSVKTTVRGDMVILPNVPVALAPGDTVEVGVGLANNIAGSGKDVPIALTLSVTGGLEVVGAAQQVLKINEKGESSTRFQVRAKPGAQAELGSASVVFEAQYKNSSARLSTDVSVRPASPKVTLVQAGSFQGMGDLTAQGDFYPNFRKSDVAVSAAPWAFASGLMQYLEAYPHGCTEQITSQTFPSILLANQAQLALELAKRPDAKDGTKEAERDPRKLAQATLQRYLAQLRPRQTADGGFALWPGNGSDPFATTYALHLLIEANDRKLGVPQDLVQKANIYLQAWLGRTDGSQYNWRVRTQAAYLLTRQGILLPSALANMREAWRAQTNKSWQDDLGAAYLAASYQLLKQDAVANELLQPAWADLLDRTAKKTRRNSWDYYYDPIVHDSMLVHLVAKHFPERLKALPANTWTRTADMLRDGWYNSLSSASMLLAIDAYYTVVNQDSQGKLNATAIDKQGQATALALGPLTPLTRANVPINAAKLRLTNAGDFPLYYSWAEQGFERNVPEAANNQGMEVFHEVVNAKGDVITEAALGDEVFVRVRLRSLKQNRVASVALIDVLPGGLEPVLQPASDSVEGANNGTGAASNNGTSGAVASIPADAPLWRRRLGNVGSWGVTYADVREDRVVFYGDISTELQEVTYKVRATNVGEFVVPAAYGEAMYDRRIFARSAGGKFRVVPAKAAAPG
jgi:alpha-2-macroglobulin